MTTGSPFDDLARELPDGAFWATGAWFKRVLAALTADRVRAGSNLDELPSDKGRFFNAKAGGDAADAAIPPLSILDASAKDSAGNPHPDRIRVTLGYFDGLRPAEMQVPDILLPSGTDNRCYLTMQEGDNYVYGKVLVDPDAGLNTSASVYAVDSEEEADSTYVYRLLGIVNFSDEKLTIVQINRGNQSLAVLSSASGTFTGFWGSQP